MLRAARDEQLDAGGDGGHQPGPKRLGTAPGTATASPPRRTPTLTKFAQAGIKPDDVAREVAEIRASLGTGGQIEGVHLGRRSSALWAPVAGPRGTTASSAVTTTLPIGLRDALATRARTPTALPSRSSSATGEGRPPRPHRRVRGRRSRTTSWTVRARSRRLRGTLRPARRCGVMRTEAVIRRTTLLVVRFRLHLVLPGSGRSTPPGGRRGPGHSRSAAGPTTAEWLSPADVQALLAAQPSRQRAARPGHRLRRAGRG